MPTSCATFPAAGAKALTLSPGGEFAAGCLLVAADLPIRSRPDGVTRVLPCTGGGPRISTPVKQSESFGFGGLTIAASCGLGMITLSDRIQIFDIATGRVRPDLESLIPRSTRRLVASPRRCLVYAVLNAGPALVVVAVDLERKERRGGATFVTARDQAYAETAHTAISADESRIAIGYRAIAGTERDKYETSCLLVFDFKRPERGREVCLAADVYFNALTFVSRDRVIYSTTLGESFLFDLSRGVAVPMALGTTTAADLGVPAVDFPEFTYSPAAHRLAVTDFREIRIYDPEP